MEWRNASAVWTAATSFLRMGLDLPAGDTATLRGHTGPVLAVRFNSDGNYCLTCGQDRIIKLWNPAKGLCVKTYVGHGHEVFDVAVSGDNSRITSCGGDKQVFYWDVASGNVIRKFRGHDLKVNTCVFAGEESSVIVSGSYDKTVKIFDCRSRSFDAMQTMAEATDSITSLAVRGHEVLSACVDGYVRRYDVRMGEVVSDCLGHPITCVRFTRDGNCVLATCMDSTVRLLDKANGELLNSYSGHRNESYKVESAMTRGDAYVACGSEDGKIFFWDLVSGKLAHQLHGHSNVVCGLSYHPSKTALLSSSVDGTFFFWQ